MGRIFLSAGHGGIEDGVRDPGVIISGTTEAQEMILLRDQVVPLARSQGLEVLTVPDDLGLQDTIDWINSRSRPDDVALELHADNTVTTTRGAAVFYIAQNQERQAHAEMLLLYLLRQVPQLPTRGAKPDTQSGLGRLAFCRQVRVPSLLMEVGNLSNPQDRFVIQNQRRELAAGLADGLAAWSRAIASSAPSPAPEPAMTQTFSAESATVAPSAVISPPPGRVYPGIGIRINGATYPEQGLIINGNSYIPIDLVDQLGIDLSAAPEVTRIRYGNVVYIKAVDLRNYAISVSWENSTRTVVLQSVTQICPGEVDRIMGRGNTSEVQLTMFLQSRNPEGLARFPDLPMLYRQEAAIEGVNYDIAFCQMCVETGYLSFGGDIRPEQNNFGGLGAVGGGAAGASFPSARIGVRAQVQHLKAYGSTAPLVQELVDPRFRFVARGIAPLVQQLSGRWAADPDYGLKILSVVRQLYESAGLL
jgi:hypothetical protein